jgi:hypothetical protein
MMAKHKTDEERESRETDRTRNRGQNDGIGTENDPHGAASPDPRKNRGQNEGLGTESKPSGAAPGMPDARVRSEAPQKPVSSGPTVADADAPVLEGHEGEHYETVYLTAGPDKGSPFRVATPLPQVVVAGGQRYLRSTHDTYVWQVP